MNRYQLIRALRRYARKRDLDFMVDTNRGKGSHYVVRIGAAKTTVQDKLTPGRITAICKQLNIEFSDL